WAGASLTECGSKRARAGCQPWSPGRLRAGARRSTAATSGPRLRPRHCAWTARENHGAAAQDSLDARIADMAIVTFRYWAAAKDAAGATEEQVATLTLAEAPAQAGRRAPSLPP